MRGILYGQLEELLDNIGKVCLEIEKQKNKTILIIIDELDKLEPKFAEKIFFDNQFLLTQPQVKIIYTFPLDTYYLDEYIRISDRYDDQFIPLVNLKNKDGIEIQDNIKSLWVLITRRISVNLIKPGAGNYLIEHSGGLLRDLVKFMQGACRLAIVAKKEIIDLEIAQQVVSKYSNDFYRVFDTSKYMDALEEIAVSKGKDGNEKLIYFLHHLFVLEYRQGSELWFDIHPCFY